MAKGFVKINEDYCKSCELCISVCPKKILTIDSKKVNLKGYFPVTVTNMDDCIACANCARICPEIAISIGKLK